ncbi:MAG TPA: hypothetical protein VIL51_04300 [Thermoleophilia bacterium]
MADESEEKDERGKLWTPGGDEQPAESKDEKPASDEDMSEEELRKRIEEVMEKVTVADIVLDMMISLSSLAYQRMGIPHEVNEKFKDMEQARLAIDCLDALCTVLYGRVDPQMIEPLKSTCANLKLNFAKES